MMRKLWVVAGVAMLLAPATAAVAEESLMGHREAKNKKEIMVGKEVIIPGDTTMSSDDVVEFQNMYMGILVIDFIEPKDVQDKIHCELPKGKTYADDPDSAPWDLFEWNGSVFRARLPPGRFASLCKLEPGNYAFTVNSWEEAGRGHGVLPKKGTITVQ